MKRFDSVKTYAYSRPIDRDHWLVLEGVEDTSRGYSETDHAAESNWEYCVGELEADATPGCEIHNNMILIHPWRIDLRDKAEDIERALNNSGILDEDDFSQRENEDIEEQWECWGYSDLLKEVTKYLAPFKDTDIDIVDADTYELRRIIEDRVGYGLIACRDSYFSRIKNVLPKIDTPKLWQHIKSVQLDKESFDALSRDVYLVLHTHKVTVTDYWTDGPLEVPDYIVLHYNNPRQPNLL